MARKMTRNSYKRRIIVIGIMVFACIALISTGFAAWIISTNATAEQNGNISVGKVTDSSITIEDVQLSSSNFYFEPAEGDTTGRIRNNDTDPSESLSVTVNVLPTPSSLETDISPPKRSITFFTRARPKPLP